MSYVIITGNQMDGFSCIGPFDHREAALRYMETCRELDGLAWWLSELRGANDNVNVNTQEPSE